jgi:hypothetical protein
VRPFDSDAERVFSKAVARRIVQYGYELLSDPSTDPNFERRASNVETGFAAVGLAYSEGEAVRAPLAEATADSMIALFFEGLSGLSPATASRLPARAKQAGELSLLNQTKRANEIREQLVDRGIVSKKRAYRLPIGVTDANDPRVPRIITVGDEVAHDALASGRIPLAPDEVLGPRPIFDEQRGLLLESHVESMGARHARDVYGATGGEIGTVPRQCPGCLKNMAGSTWTHTNPQRPKLPKKRK